jgi:hypothetical protein
MIGQQYDFSGGLDLLSADINIDSTSYQMLVNARQRYGYVEPILSHEKIINAPQGKKLGCIGVGNVLILFVAGNAYYQKDGNTDWNIIPGLNMDDGSKVDQYWLQPIPAPSLQMVRKANTTSANSPIVLDTDFRVTGTNQRRSNSADVI